MHAIRIRPFPGFSAAVHEADRPVLLLVQNDTAARRPYADVLCYNGFNVILTFDAAAARTVVSLLVPDLILVDLELPRRQGLELCRLAAVTSRGSRVPVLALGEDVDRTVAQSSGCSSYLARPFSPVALLHNVEEIVGRPPAPGEDPTPWMIAYPLSGAE